MKDGIGNVYVGTDKYVSPEIKNKNKYVISSASVYTFAVYIYTIFFGKFPTKNFYPSVETHF
jgi:serine/threonine protein kinase